MVCQDDGVYTRITSSDGAVSWKLPVLDVDSAPGPDFYLESHRWSPDGKYLFLTPQCFCSIDGPGLAFVDGFGLFRLSLRTGYLEQWFAPDLSGYAFSFSADQRLIAYAYQPNQTHTVHIRDLETGNETALHFKEKYDSIGNFAWAKDNSALIIVAGLDGWADLLPESGISVFSYSMVTHRLKVLVENVEGNLFPVSGYDYETRIGSPWLSDNILLMGDPLYGGDAWTLNIQNGTLAKYATPVVTPTYNP